MGIIARTSISITGRAILWQLISADDVNLLARGVDGIRAAVVSLFVMVIFGVPFSWKKLKGGFVYSWVGLEIDLTGYRLGLSLGRAQWLCDWIDGVIEKDAVLIRDLASVLGRLAFAAGPLGRSRPFLSPRFAWTSIAPGGAYLQPPPDVLLCLRWLRLRLSRGGRTEACIWRQPGSDILFRSDAKAEDALVVIRGWECKGGTPPTCARWFSATLDQDNAPWVFCKGEPFKVISALELLATLVSVILFMPADSLDEGRIELSGSALTDNKGNSYVVKKMMMTAFPLNACLMELSEQLEQRSSWLDVQWVPRDQNIEADALTNGHFAGFDPNLRIDVSMKDLPFIVLPAMLEAGGARLAELAEMNE